MEKSASERFLNGAYETIKFAPCTVYVGTKKYRVKQVAQEVKSKIALLELDAQYLEAKGKTGLPLKEARKVSNQLHSLHSKKAAYYLLGNWALFVPFLWAITWRILQLRGDETTFRIIEAGIGGSDLGFSKANWDTSRLLREHYMSPVGDAAQQAQERLESVLNMLETDALGVKKENK